MTQRGRKSNNKRPLWAEQLAPSAPPPPPPKHLGPQEVTLWHRVLDEFDITGPVSFALLTAALEAHQRARLAREQVAKDGMTVRAKGGLKAHPLIAVERAARHQLVATLRKMQVSL